LPFDQAVIAWDAEPNDPNFQGTLFSGSFDGNDHQISNMTVTGESYLGLFGMVGSQGEISNLGIVDVEDLIVLAEHLFEEVPPTQ